MGVFTNIHFCIDKRGEEERVAEYVFEFRIEKP